MFTIKNIIGIAIILMGFSILFNFSFWRIIWPVLLILIGLSLLFNRMPEYNAAKQESTHENKIEYSAVFSELNKKVISDNFQGGKVDTVFGGGTFDLRDAKIRKGETVTLEVNAVFGGLKVIVPDTWTVNNSVTGVFGAFSNNTNYPKEGKEQGRIILKGGAVFGGGEVTN